MLGIDDAFVASMHRTLTSKWMEHAHTAVAGAVIDCAALALFKAWGGPRAPSSRISFA